jgi:hypothetical protein
LALFLSALHRRVERKGRAWSPWTVHCNADVTKGEDVPQVWFSVGKCDKRKKPVLRVNECTPTGLLTALAYWDLVPIRDRPDLVRDVVLAAIKPGRHQGDAPTSQRYWRAARTVLHPEIRPTVS